MYLTRVQDVISTVGCQVIKSTKLLSKRLTRTKGYRGPSRQGTQPNLFFFFGLVDAVLASLLGRRLGHCLSEVVDSD